MAIFVVHRNQVATTRGMAFAVWLDEDLAWAEGTHEYRPMGVAVVACTDLFRPRDFRPSRKAPSRDDVRFLGFFASLEDVNRYLERRRHDPSEKTAPAFLR
jgi:hypothetical protein